MEADERIEDEQTRLQPGDGVVEACAVGVEIEAQARGGDAYLRRDGLNVVVEVERVEKLRVPLHLLSGVVLFGQVSLSPALMGSLAEAGVATAFFGMNGRFLARVEGPVSGNVLLRREQYRVMDDGPARTRVASGIVAAKALNQRGVLQRALRDHSPALANTAKWAISAAVDRM